MITANTTCEIKLSPEQQIRDLESKLKESRCDVVDAREEADRYKVQVQSLTNVMLDQHQYIKELENVNKWDKRRMDEYRNTLYQISRVCEEVKGESEAAELAKKIMEIVRRF